MTCHDARELFSALLDETLTREERADVYGHLVTCGECRRELAAIERTVALVRAASPVRAPVGFVDRVVKAARPTPWYVRAGRAALLPWPIKLPLAAAALLLVGGLAVLMFRGTPEQQRAARPAPEAQVFQDRSLSAPAAPPGSPPTTPPAETPAKTPATPSRDAASNDQPSSAREQDRTAAVASRIDEADKRAETEKRDAESEQSFSRARAPAPTAQSAPPAATDTLAKQETTSRTKAAAAPQVIARLAAPDRDTAERALAALAARLGGTVAGRRVEGDTSVVELMIPRQRYDDFTREAARLGVLRVESEPPGPSDTVRIAVHLAS